MRDWLWASMVVGLVLTGVAGASAQRGRSSETETAAVVAPPSGPGETEARALFEAGRQAFTDGRFEDALQRFSQSYELSHRAELLFNIGQAADRLRRDAEALAAFERYLALLPEAANRREVEGRIAVLRQASAERGALQQTSAGSGEQPTVSTGAASERDASIEPLPASPSPAADTAPEGENLLEAWWLWTIVGVVVLSGVGVGVGVAATTPAATAPGDVGGVVVTLGGAW